jgi:MFS family permease
MADGVTANEALIPLDIATGDVNATAKEAPERVALGAWWMLFVLFLLYVVSLLDRQVLTMLVEPIKRDLSLSDVEMSIILGPAFAIFYGLFGWPLGWAADRYPRRWVIYLGVTFWSLAATASGLAQSFVALLLCRIGVGAGEASLTPAAYALMGDRFPKRRLTTAMSIYQTGSMVGTAAAFAIGGLVIHFAEQLASTHIPFIGPVAPWQLTLILTGSPSILLALLVFTFSEPERRHLRQRGPGVDRTRFLRFMRDERALLLPMALGFSLMVMLGTALIAWVPAYITRDFGWPPERYGPLLGLVSIISGVTMVAKGWVVDWLYARGMRDAHLRFYTWLVVLALPVAIASFTVRDIIAFLILYGALQVLVVQFIVYVAATVHLVTPSDLRAQTIAVFISIFSLLGSGLGPLSAAMITDYVLGDPNKLGTSLLIMSVVCLPAAWICLRIALRAVHAAMARRESDAAA